MTRSPWSDLLDPQAAIAAEALAAALPAPLHSLGLDGVRAFAASPAPPRTTPMASVCEHVIRPMDGSPNSSPILVRHYQPTPLDPVPAVLYFHGGGFTVGSLDGVDELCRRIAIGTECAVFSVDYRLAPEHPFPAAIDDATIAYRWLRENAWALGIDADRIAVAGDSAGGGIAAALCLDARAHSLAQPIMQVLVYPAVDDSFTRASWVDYADAPLLGTADALWFWRQYVGPTGVAPSELAAPMRATTLTGLAPAHVITAEIDPLRDDAEAYADRLADDGVTVTRQRYRGVFHGFFTEVETYAKANQAVNEACAHLRAAFGLEDLSAELR